MERVTGSVDASRRRLLPIPGSVSHSNAEGPPGSTGGPSALERVTGIEPAWPAWKAGALPLSYTREWCWHIIPCRCSDFGQGPRQRPTSRRFGVSTHSPLDSAGAAGRSVVASAPALGAGDREFESPRPDSIEVHSFRTPTSTISSCTELYARVPCTSPAHRCLPLQRQASSSPNQEHRST